MGDAWGDFPRGHSDEHDLFLDWLRYLRAAVIRKIEGLSDEQARWRPDGALISLVGIVNHLTNVEWRWIDGALLGGEVQRREEEFTPGPELTVTAAVAAYRARAAATDNAGYPCDSSQRVVCPSTIFAIAVQRFGCYRLWFASTDGVAKTSQQEEVRHGAACADRG